MSLLSDAVLEASDTGCCVIRMGSCQCAHHIDEAGKRIAVTIRHILVHGDSTELLLYLDLLDQGC